MNAPIQWRNHAPKVRQVEAPSVSPPIIRPQAPTSNEEPSLDELFAEPIIMLLMARDGIDRQKLRMALASVSRHLAEVAASKHTIAPPNPEPRPPMRRGPLCLDRARHRCTWKGHNVDLTVTEFALLDLLAERPDYVKTRDQLMDVAMGKGAAVYDRTIDSHIKRMRGKFKAVDKDFAQIQTVWGIGYRYVGDAKPNTRDSRETCGHDVIPSRNSIASRRR